MSCERCALPTYQQALKENIIPPYTTPPKKQNSEKRHATPSPIHTPARIERVEAWALALELQALDTLPCLHVPHAQLLGPRRHGRNVLVVRAERGVPTANQ
jgi:hypothetical protein